MTEISIEIVATETLQAIARYISIAIQEIWASLSSPYGAPGFAGGLIKFSLGPTLAFLLSQRSAKEIERRKNKKEEDAKSDNQRKIRLLTRLEVSFNCSILGKIHVAIISLTGNLYSDTESERLHEIAIFAIPFTKKFATLTFQEIAESFANIEIVELIAFYSQIERIESVISQAKIDRSIARYAISPQWESLLVAIENASKIAENLLETLSKDEG
jgi:hypothetical protein